LESLDDTKLKEFFKKELSIKEGIEIVIVDNYPFLECESSKGYPFGRLEIKFEVPY
jgi:hypothetical protein